MVFLCQFVGYFGEELYLSKWPLIEVGMYSHFDVYSCFLKWRVSEVDG